MRGQGLRLRSVAITAKEKACLLEKPLKELLTEKILQPSAIISTKRREKVR